MLYCPNPNIKLLAEDDYKASIEEIEHTIASYSHKGVLASFDDIKLAYEYVLVENAKASLVFIHGYSEFRQKFTELAWYMMNMGYNIFLYDLRGHGKSDREVMDSSLIHVNQFEDYINDLDAVINQLVIKVSPNVPIYLYAHSMGGAIAGYYLAKPDCKVTKAVLSSPMVRPNTYHAPSLIVKSYASHSAHRHGWNARFPKSPCFNPQSDFINSNDSSPARYEHFLDIRRNDADYQCCVATNAWMYQSMRVKKHLLSTKTTKAIHAKILLLSAGQDRVVLNSPQKRFADMLADCRYYQFLDSKHSIYSSTYENRKKLMELLIDFYQ